MLHLQHMMHLQHVQCVAYATHHVLHLQHVLQLQHISSKLHFSQKALLKNIFNCLDLVLHGHALYKSKEKLRVILRHTQIITETMVTGSKTGVEGPILACPDFVPASKIQV